MSQPYTNHYNTQKTPQNQPIPGRESEMVKNAAGGFTFTVDNWKRMERFLILGSEGGTYYVTEQKLTIENAKNVTDCIREDGKRVVDMTLDISKNGRSMKNDAAIFVLAMCTSANFANQKTRAYAFRNLNDIVRIGTHMFQFMEFRKNLGAGTGRGLRNAIAKWYTTKDPDQLAYQVVKYPSRVVTEGKSNSSWSHKDVLRVAHPKAENGRQNAVLKYAVTRELTVDSPALLGGVEFIRTVNVPVKNRAKYIEEFNFTREMLPTEWLKDPKVWEALLNSGQHGMPVGAMIRNLGNMSKSGLLSPMSDAEKQVAEKITNSEVLKMARVHPLNILVASKIYSQGGGFRGKGQWDVSQKIVDALDTAFYASFDAVEPTGKRFLLGCDVSGSMGSEIPGAPVLSCAEGVGVMAMTTARVEENHHIMKFSDTFSPLNISPRSRLKDIMKLMQDWNFGRTDCALPMVYAAKKKIPVDVFVVYTDNETWYDSTQHGGSGHPVQALQNYREKMGIPAKLIVVAMVSSWNTIADPKDAGMLDVEGFDTSTPKVISNFSLD